MGLCPIWPLGQRTLAGTGPFSPLVGQRLCAVGAATGALGRCALEKGGSCPVTQSVCKSCNREQSIFAMERFRIRGSQACAAKLSKNSNFYSIHEVWLRHCDRRLPHTACRHQRNTRRLLVPWATKHILQGVLPPAKLHMNNKRCQRSGSPLRFLHSLPH